MAVKQAVPPCVRDGKGDAGNSMKKFAVSSADRTSEIQLFSNGRITIDGKEKEVEWIALSSTRRVLRVNGRSFDIDVLSVSRGGNVHVLVNGFPLEISVKDERSLLLHQFGFGGSLHQQAGEVKAPMPGLITKVLVKPGDVVQTGQGVIVLEAMKMENELTAPADGTVKAVHVREREAVDKNAILIELE